MIFIKILSLIPTDFISQKDTILQKNCLYF